MCRADVTIATARYDLDERRPDGIITECATQSLHRRIETVFEVHERPSRHKRWRNSSRLITSPGRSKWAEDVERLSLQANAEGSVARLARREVELKGAHTHGMQDLHAHHRTTTLPIIPG